MKRISLLLCSLFIAVTGFSQITDLGGPKSLTYKNQLATLQPVMMPAFDLAHEKMIDSINDANKIGPWRFGFNHDVSLGLNNAGNWTNFPNGDRVWRLRIKSKYALTMNVIFDQFDLPQGASVYLYSPDMSSVYGAYTAANNNAEHVLGSELIDGPEIVIEYYEPAAVTGQGTLNVGTVTHGYRSLSIIQNQLIKALNSSGDCNIDILCPLGVGWEDQAAAVAMIVVSGNGICTGTLMNNTTQDGTPYFLTANHCGTTGGGTWAFRFHWNSPNPSCATTTPSTNGTYDQTLNGATLRSSNSGSDFALWTIDNLTLATAQSWNLYYAGWDNGSTPATVTTGIHHPSGDIKKICRDDNTLIANVWNFNGNANTQIWRVDAWEQGVTEPGSSGSAIFNSSGLVVGQLAGGSAACTGTTSAGYDGYGRFDVSWDGANATTRLRDWLDPANSTTVLPGWDPNAPSVSDDAGIQSITTPAGAICASSFIPEVVLRNAGTNSLTSVTIQYDIDGGTTQTYNWTGNLASGVSTTVTLPSMTTSAGSHTFNANTTLPNGNADGNTANDASASIFYLITSPETVDFSISVDCWGSETTWEVRDGATVLYSGGPYADGQPNGSGTFTDTWCLQGGACYDFVIADTYGDGMYGSQYGSCNVDGTYSIDQGATNLATILAANSDYGNQEINNFCVTAVGGGVTADFTGTPLSLCAGSSVNFIDVSTGSPTTWSWTFAGGSPGTSTQQNPIITYNTPGTYDVTLTASDGTTPDTKTVTGYVTVYPNPTASITATNESCAGLCDGTATANASGGSAPYTYFWDAAAGNQTTATATGLCSGVYSCDITDSNGCTTTVLATIGSPSALVSTTFFTNVSCNGFCDGSATVTASGGTSPYSFQWDAGTGNQTTATATNLCAGSYSVTVTDANGCTDVQNVTITEPTAVFINLTSTDPSCAGTCDGSIISGVTGGTPPYTYSWTGGITGANPTGVCAGTYTLTVTDANGCSANSNITLSDPASIVLTSTPTDESTAGACDGSISNSVSGSTPPHQYSIDGGTTWQNPSTFNGLCAGTYTVTVINGNGCTTSQVVTIGSGGSPITIADATTGASCFGVCDGSSTVTVTGGVPPYTYAWNDPSSQTSATATGLCAGTYTVTVTDNNSTTATHSVTVSEPFQVLLSCSSTDESACNTCDGSVNCVATGGTPPYQYSFDGGATFTASNGMGGLCAGVYNVIVEDANGCQGTEVVTINSGGTFAIGVNSTDASCAGMCDGLASTFGMGGGTPPYSWLWSDGQTTQTATNLCAGSYTVSVTDGNGCVANGTAVINEPTTLNVNGGATDESTCGANDGTITLSAAGGTSPYTFSIDGGTTFQSSGVFTGLAAGVYITYAQDANGCLSNAFTLVINGGSAGTLNITSVDVSCFGTCDGSATVTITGGTAPFNYQWDAGAGNQTTPTATNLCSGTYSVTVTDAGGCTAVGSVTINEPTQVMVTGGSTDESSCGANDGTITLSGGGGTSPYTFSIDGGATFQSSGAFSGLSPGVYVTYAQDANGCLSNAFTLVINGGSGFGITFNTINTTCFGLCDGSSTAIPSGGTAPYTYQWDAAAGNQTNPTASGLCAGTYTCVITDNNGCTGTGSVTVTEPAQLFINSTSSNANCGVCDGSATAIASGSTGPFSYQWDDPLNQTTTTASGLCAGVYTCTVFDANGCSEVATVTVGSTGGGITATATVINHASCNGVCDGAAVATATGGTSPYTYSWDSGGTSSTVTGLCAGTHVVTATDANGCTGSYSITVTEPSPIFVNPASTDANCGQCDGTAFGFPTGGTSPYTYQWDDPASQTTQTATGLCAGVYILTVTDANGCVSITSIPVNSSGGVTATVVNATNASCFGSCDGSITTAVTGGTAPYTFNWSNGASTQNLSNLCAGVYTLSVTDASGCTGSLVVTIGEPSQLSGSTTSTDANCGACDGTATVSASGGTPGYTYQWDAGTGNQTTATATNLCAGTYLCQIIDVNGCVASVTAVVNSSGGVVVTAAGTDVTCFGLCDGSATATANGTFPITYQWDAGAGNQTSPTATGLCAGTYTVTATDANGCTGTTTVVINEPTPLAVTATTTDEMLGNDGAIDLFVTGGTPPYTYSWDNGATTQDLNGLTAGVYVVTVTDANGCSSITTWTVGSQVGIEDLSAENWFVIGPNPTSSQVVVRDARSNGAYVVYAVYDAAGRLIFNDTFSNETQIDLSTYERGVYFIHLNTGDELVVKQIIRN